MSFIEINSLYSDTRILYKKKPRAYVLRSKCVPRVRKHAKLETNKTRYKKINKKNEKTGEKQSWVLGPSVPTHDTGQRGSREMHTKQRTPKMLSFFRAVIKEICSIKRVERHRSFNFDTLFSFSRILSLLFKNQIYKIGKIK